MKMMNGQDAFEHALKQALEPYEVPYNSADWAQLEKRLDEGKSSGWQASAALYALLLGGTLAVATTLQVLITPEPPVGGNGLAVIQQDEQGQDVPSDVRPEQADGAVAEQPLSGGAPVKTGMQGTAPVQAKSPNTPARTAAVQPAEPVNAHPAPAPSGMAIKSSVTEGCPGTTVEFAVENMPGTGIHLWNFGDGSFSNKPTPSHTFSKPGSYEVMLSHSAVGGGNIENKPASDLIVIHEAPEAAFNFLKQEYDNTVPSVHFENRSQGGKEYQWDFGDGNTSKVAHPDHVFKKKGVYQVVLTTRNNNGCTDRIEHTVRIDQDYDLLAPKTFSPDGNGVDDLFLPEALKTLGVKFHLSVFDARSGQLVYETVDPARPWNGRIANKGEECSTGDYMWMVEMRDGEKLGGTYNGTVSLLR